MELMFTINFITQIAFVLIIIRHLEQAAERRDENNERLLRKLDNLISKQQGRL